MACLEWLFQPSGSMQCTWWLAEADILKMGILVSVPLPTFRDPTSQFKILGLEIFPHPTCKVKGSGDCEFLHPISHKASEKWEVGHKREFPFLKYLPLLLPSRKLISPQTQERFPSLMISQEGTSMGLCDKFRIHEVKKATYQVFRIVHIAPALSAISAQFVFCFSKIYSGAKISWRATSLNNKIPTPQRRHLPTGRFLKLISWGEIL